MPILGVIQVFSRVYVPVCLYFGVLLLHCEMIFTVFSCKVALKLQFQCSCTWFSLDFLIFIFLRALTLSNDMRKQQLDMYTLSLGVHLPSNTASAPD